MATKSIQQRAEEYAFESNCVKLYSDSNGETCKWICPNLHDGCSCESCEKDYFAYIEIATEQDRIARKEERERCIKAAQDWYCKNVCFVKECVIIETCCKRHEEIREAMEKGGA